MLKATIGYFGWVIACLWVGAYVIDRLGGVEFFIKTWWGAPAAITAGLLVIIGGWLCGWLVEEYL